MAHFAEIDENNIVSRVLVVDNSQEHRGQEFLAEDLGLGGRWIQTSYNANIRGKFAGIGDTYNEEKDIFMSPRPYPSWTFDDVENIWVSPVPYPQDDFVYIWNEELLSWEKSI